MEQKDFFGCVAEVFKNWKLDKFGFSSAASWNFFWVAEFCTPAAATTMEIEVTEMEVGAAPFEFIEPVNDTPPGKPTPPNELHDVLFSFHNHWALLEH